MNNTKLKFELTNDRATLPKYAHASDSGMDISSCEEVTILPNSHARIDTGVRAEIPDGYELQVRPRSGLSSRGIVAVFGTVDCGYRGEIGVTLYNLTQKPYAVNVGDRIAQLVLAPVTRADIEQGIVFDGTDRGTNGFGSTGV